MDQPEVLSPENRFRSRQVW